MGLAPYGKREIIGGGLLLIAFGVASGIWFPYVMPLFVILLLWLLWFFRDPERPIPDRPRVFVAPADGVVVEVAEVEEDEYIGGPALRIAIFLNIFNVHVNRAPCAGTVEYVKYHPGKFLPAWDEKTNRENERNCLGIAVPDEKGGRARVLVRQIAGLIARRIVCVAGEGQSLERGQRIGMIKFGSRTELSVSAALPFKPLVKVGDKVYGGRTVMGEIV